MTSPLELLTNKFDREQPWLTDKYNPVACALLGFGAACFVNWGFRKPIFSGVQRHVLFTVAGGAIGTIVDKRRNEYLAERDAVLRHYIELHPEDFPTPERKKYADVFEPWVPIR